MESNRRLQGKGKEIKSQNGETVGAGAEKRS